MKRNNKLQKHKMLCKPSIPPLNPPRDEIRRVYGGIIVRHKEYNSIVRVSYAQAKPIIPPHSSSHMADMVDTEGY
jgi:hypothetical protein